MTTELAPVDGISICWEALGEPGDPTVLLIGGLAASMDVWEPAFCQQLADRGRRVVRYDHRDTGGSTQCPAGAPDYTSDALTTDPIGLLDALGVARAHIVGVSMGGGITQDLAARVPDRLLTATVIAGSAAGDRRSTVDLPPPTAALAATFDAPLPDPDWSDDAAVVEHLVAVERPYAGGLGFDVARARRIAGIVVARTPDLHAACVNHMAAEHGDAPPFQLEAITVPTMVMHGTDDPLFPFPHGRALADEIPGAVLVPLDGMGHEHPPPPLWDVVIDRIVRHTA